jgi:hypothetical protein
MIRLEDLTTCCFEGERDEADCERNAMILEEKRHNEIE